MSCSPFDIKDYFLKELTDPRQRQMEVHIRSCPPCREELDRLRLTEAAMFSLRDEEIPQRIAFVSDQVFEPSPWRRWWSAFWGSSARLGFASAAMLSAALVFFAVTRPAPVLQKMVAANQPAPIVSTVSDDEIRQRVHAAVESEVGAAVEKAVAYRTKDLRADLEQARSSLILEAANFENLQKRDRVRYAQANYQAAWTDGANQ